MNAVTQTSSITAASERSSGLNLVREDIIYD